MKIINPSLVSIIIPIFNVSKFLKEAINSVCKQTHSNIEIILVNDGSTDNSPEICNHYKQLDNRIKVIHKENEGLSSARNAGIEIATGDYIFFLDGDDFIDVKTVELLLKGFDYNSNIGIVSSPCFYSYNNGNIQIFSEQWNIQIKRTISYNDFCLATLQQTSCHSACSKLYKKELFKNLRFREGKKNEDTLFMFDLSNVMIEKEYNMLEIPDKLYYYRVTQGSISRNLQCPIQIDIVENLQTLIFETKKHKIRKILKNKFYDEFLSFYSILLLDKKFKEQIRLKDLNRFDVIFKNTNFFDLIIYSSFKNALKYFIFKYFPSMYINRKQIK